MKYETHFLLNYVTSECRIVQLIGNIFLGLIALFKPPNNETKGTVKTYTSPSFGFRYPMNDNKRIA
jgi:hypothetical protein